MTADPTGLDRLHDIVVPAPVPWWPPAPGWLWLLGVALAVALGLLARGFVHWQHNRYRREALAELAGLAATAQAPPPNDVVRSLAELLKRTALSAYPRERVAALTGPGWFEFLDRTAGTRFADGLGAALEGAVHSRRPADWDAARFREVVSEVRTWIQRHGPVTENTPGKRPDDGATPVTGARRAA